MDQNTARFINNAKSLAELAQIEENAQRKNALTPEIKEAISRRASDFGRLLIEEKTGLDLSILSPAEERIVQAIILDAEEAAINSDTLAEMDKKYKGASLEVKERLSRTIERGPIGKEVKRVNGYRCQLCEALGFEPLGFKKSNGEHYVEAHHVIAVSKREAGSLSASNIMTLCANHHRQVHYGDVNITILECSFEVSIGDRSVSITRYKA